jgi:argininosuccinate lyase
VHVGVRLREAARGRRHRLLGHAAEAQPERAVEAGSDPALLATDAAEALVREGVPFREAYERVAGVVRSGELEAGAGAEESVAARAAPGPGGVDEALAAARDRFAKI